MIKDELCVCHLATGDMLREAIASQTEIGMKAQEIMEKGELVPDALVIDLIKARLEIGDCERGVLLDGFPRTLP